eukprot:TRINITY_DN5584_c0_g2_i1.p2 TRINITY_DN5584_c0_g2~~TRINITY_DN5584_c0_g2_i1.p2  ORF type:complete len:255 (-),score=52.44 TRINITY_DN5584_c0_g2_i1:577-1341(-)
MQELAFFKEHGGADLSPLLRTNQNWDYFPMAKHWPIVPQEAWPSLAHFLEEHYVVFREGLEAFLEADPSGSYFDKASKKQAGLTPFTKHGWSRVKLIHSGGASEFCELPFFRRTCELLLQRPEIDARYCTRTPLIGASLSRLLPGSELKPHFGSHPRWTVHLGLRAPKGASMTVAGETVEWKEGRAIVFDDTYIHLVRHRGAEARYVLVAWFCHPCDLRFRQSVDAPWMAENPLPEFCGGGSDQEPYPGYGDPP